MIPRLLELLRCPRCARPFELVAQAPSRVDDGDEVSAGLLRCDTGHSYPVVGGIPRLLPHALAEHRDEIEAVGGATGPVLERLLDQASSSPKAGDADDRRTRTNFSHEWGHHELGGRTWGMDLDDRVRWFFLEPLRLPAEELVGKVLLDAGCGNGSQSVAYTELGLEVIAVDLSSGLEHGHSFRHRRPGARPDQVHFVQADLQAPPLAPASVDIIHSAGVLYHTPDTEATFRRLCPLLRPGGTFYTWLYKREPGVTALVDALRAVTTRMAPPAFDRVARLMADPFRAFCSIADRLGLRRYARLSREEAALALLDIFGAPHAHAHTYDEVAGWYESEGFSEVWPCNEGRRGFGVCGRKAAA